jgi:hypothetical protein
MVGVMAGVLWSRRYAILAEYLQHNVYLAPGRAELGDFTRRFVLGSFEWSRSPLQVDGLGDLGGAIRGTTGAVLREGLGAGWVVGVGAAGRVGLIRHLSVVLDLQGLLTVLPNDTVPRCPAEGSLTPNCSPFASAETVRPEAWIALLLELRM